MKVYTHFYKTKENEGLRWRTLLQFGDSWNILGSVVMKNPGSSAPKSSIEIQDTSLLEHLALFDDIDNRWYEFTDDNTMQKVAVLFASYYGLDYVYQLNGVIQIFNLFYIMDPDEKAAEEKLLKAGLPAKFHTEDDLLKYDLEHLTAPTYLGFGDLAFKNKFKNSAKRFFDAVINGNVAIEYLNSCFEKNSFYHPQFLCGKGCNNPKSIFIRSKFRVAPMQQKLADLKAPLPKFKMPKTVQLNIIRNLKETYKQHSLTVFQYDSSDLKTIRFLLSPNLQITITSTSNGYIGIRHTDCCKIRNYCTDCYPNKVLLDNYFLSQKGFERNERRKTWLGTKDLESFGNAQNIFDFIVEAQNFIKNNDIENY